VSEISALTRAAATTRSRRGARTRTVTLGILNAVALVLAFAPAARANSLQLGQPAPPVTLVTLDGQHIASSDLHGQVVILTFWATWCVPCRKELPLLSAYALAHASQGLAVLAFSLDAPEDVRRVQQVAQTLGFPSGLLSASSAPGYGRIWHIPVNFTINRDGLLVDNGWKDKQPVWTAERLERIVTPLLGAGQ
jgi:cytochrome c biogenesis protein CcmG/thiol:disulfide interchange protein DsbE